MLPGGLPRKSKRMINNHTATKEAISHTSRGDPCGASTTGYAELGIGSLTLQSKQERRNLTLGTNLSLGAEMTTGTLKRLGALGTAAAAAVADDGYKPHEKQIRFGAADTPPGLEQRWGNEYGTKDMAKNNGDDLNWNGERRSHS